MNYGIGESELLAIVDSCKQWCHYVKDSLHKVKIITDYANLQRFPLDKNLSSKKARWWERLLELDIRVEYRSGWLNPEGALSSQADYDDHYEDNLTEIHSLLATSLDYSSWPSTDMISSQTSEMTALYIKYKFSLVFAATESFSWNFVLLGREEQKKIVSCDSLKNASIKESAYVIPSSEMQISIYTLQKVDPFIKWWRATLSTSSVMVWKSPVLYTCAGVSEILEQASLADNTDSSLTLLKEILNVIEAGWHVQDDPLLYKNR